MYKLIEIKAISGSFAGLVINRSIQRLSDKASIPFDPANTDYANFKAQINADEAQLEDADGDVMSADAAKTYVATLP